MRRESPQDCGVRHRKEIGRSHSNPIVLDIERVAPEGGSSSTFDIPAPPALFSVMCNEKIEVLVQTGADMEWAGALVIEQYSDGWFSVLIDTGADEWRDHLNYLEENVEWRRCMIRTRPSGQRGRKAWSEGTGGAQPDEKNAHRPSPVPAKVLSLPHPQIPPLPQCEAPRPSPEIVDCGGPTRRAVVFLELCCGVGSASSAFCAEATKSAISVLVIKVDIDASHADSGGVFVEADLSTAEGCLKVYDRVAPHLTPGVALVTHWSPPCTTYSDLPQARKKRDASKLTGLGPLRIPRTLESMRDDRIIHEVLQLFGKFEETGVRILFTIENPNGHAWSGQQNPLYNKGGEELTQANTILFNPLLRSLPVYQTDYGSYGWHHHKPTLFFSNVPLLLRDAGATKRRLLSITGGNLGATRRALLSHGRLPEGIKARLDSLSHAQMTAIIPPAMYADVARQLLDMLDGEIAFQPNFETLAATHREYEKLWGSAPSSASKDEAVLPPPGKAARHEAGSELDTGLRCGVSGPVDRLSRA